MPAATGRTPKPAGLKLLEGRAPGRDSGGRKVAKLPEFARELPSRPDDLSPEAAELWDLVVAHLPELQLLKVLDGPALRVGAETYARWRQAVAMRQAHGLLAENSQGRVAAPWVGIEERAGKEFRSWCAEFGLTPAAEGKLAKGDTSAPDDENPFA